MLPLCPSFSRVALARYDYGREPPGNSTPSRDVVEEMASNLEVYASAAPIILRNICTGSGPILPSPSPPLPNASPCSQAGPPRPYLPSLRRLRLLLRLPLPLQRARHHTPIFVEHWPIVAHPNDHLHSPGPRPTSEPAYTRLCGHTRPHAWPCACTLVEGRSSPETPLPTYPCSPPGREDLMLGDQSVHRPSSPSPPPQPSPHAPPLPPRPGKALACPSTPPRGCFPRSRRQKQTPPCHHSPTDTSQFPLFVLPQPRLLTHTAFLVTHQCRSPRNSLPRTFPKAEYRAPDPDFRSPYLNRPRQAPACPNARNCVETPAPTPSAPSPTPPIPPPPPVRLSEGRSTPIRGH